MNDEFVLDSSATMPWFFEDEITAASEQLLERARAGARIWVPALWHLEIGNVLLTALRRKPDIRERINEFLKKLRSLEINIDDVTATRAWEQIFTLAERHRLTAYDAAYLELAVRRGVPLATKDEALTAAAQAAGVRLCC